MIHEIPPTYLTKIKLELYWWRKRQHQKGSAPSLWAKKIQDKINTWIPEKIHQTITNSIEMMIKGFILGAQKINKSPIPEGNWVWKEAFILQKIKSHRKTASIEGALTGAGGLWWGLADFPLLIGVKINLLIEIAQIYGMDLKDYKERLFILTLFQLAFCSPKHRVTILNRIEYWDDYAQHLPDDIDAFDWRLFQQEYRDYIDLAKLAQLIPVIGAAVGAVVNYRLMQQLGITAMHGYRIRLLRI
jgi:uncharacterized protein (DUF697 family)